MRKLLFFTLLLLTVGSYAQEVDWRLMGANKNATFYEIQADFNEYWKDKTPARGQGYGVFKRWEAKMKDRVYPTGDLRTHDKAYENYRAWEKFNPSGERSPAGNWKELGPLSKPSGYDAGVGRVDFVRFNPTNSNIMYVSTPDGGLWHTNNGNSSSPTWISYNDFLTVVGCSDLAIAPDGVTMYLATGSWEGDKKTIGVLKSIDGGKTWSTTSLTFPLSEAFVIKRLIMDPTDPLVMLAATDGGVYRTADGWATHSITNLDLNYNLDDIKFKPGDHMTVYASGKEGTDVFWKSTDNGQNFTAITTGLPSGNDVSRIILGVTEATGATSYVYALAGNTDGGYLGTYLSTDSGTSFTTRSTMPNILNSDVPPSGNGGQATHDLAIAISPTNADIVTIGGISQYRSVDGGVNWDIMTYWYGTDPLTAGGTPNIAPYLHADVQSIEYLPGSSTTFFATCDGGISRTTDDGVTWTDLSNNLRVSQQYDVALSADEEYTMVAGLQDIGTIKNTSSSWTYIGGGDGMSCFIDHTNNNNVVVSDPNGAHSFSNDGGSTQFSLEGNGLPAATEFFSPIIQDPNVANTCYAGGRADLYKSTDFAAAATNNHTWSSIGTPSGPGSVLRFAVAPSNSSVIYTIKENTVSKTTNGGTSWSDVTATLPVSSASVKNIAVSDTDADKVWVVFSGYDAGTKVFKTEDGGSTWTDVFSATLPNLPINTIVYRNGSSTDEVYIGADIGVYVIDNTMTAWAPFKNGLANSTVNDLEIYYPTGKLRAATYGRGTWESNLFTGSAPTTLQLKVFLEGPYNATNATMNDDLRSAGYLPVFDPSVSFGFTHVNGQVESTNAATLIKNDPNNAIVDWVFVELRDKIAPSTVQHTRAALLQRDGDIVDMDGTSPLYFASAPADNYYIAVRHRNHLAFRTLASVTLGTSTTTLDFTNGTTPTFGTDALKEVNTGVYAMYAGDANRDGTINSVDRNAQWRLQNGTTYNYQLSTADFDLNGALNAVDKNAYWRVNNSKVAQID